VASPAGQMEARSLPSQSGPVKLPMKTDSPTQVLPPNNHDHDHAIDHGFLRITVASTRICVANPKANRESIEAAVRSFADSDVILFGELCLSGYTCGELFTHRTLLDACSQELLLLARNVGTKQLIVVGLPLAIDGKLLNVAAVLCDGQILGLVPKQHLPNYQEFYEARWFQSGSIPLPSQVMLGASSIPFGTDLLFTCGQAVVGIEICEDLWVPVAPSALQSIGGANVLLNLSASNETISKATYRKRLVATQSGKCIAAYAYASAGPSESTTDLVFGGHCMIAENGSILSESKRVGTGLELDPIDAKESRVNSASADVDLDRLDHDRRVSGTLHHGLMPELHRTFRHVPFQLDSRNSKTRSTATSRSLLRYVDAHPFVPSNPLELQERCDEIFEIQCAALAKRVSLLPKQVPLVLGVSGGLDSTLALIVVSQMMNAAGLDRKRFVGFTMPGFGTSTQTKDNATRLSQLLELRMDTIDIRERCFGLFQDLKHSPFGVPLDGQSVESLQKELEHLPAERRHDLMFENVQARVRTLLLMSRGFVIGTGDLSEGALGWSTYNADHMSMYNVNCSVPKTLVKFLVKHVAMTRYAGEVQHVLLDIVDTPISPELLPLAKDKSIHQSTEASLGPYELHDFFLYHFVRSGASPKKILYLAKHAKFNVDYTESQIASTLQTFLKRFFAAQFKRTCVPDGPKVGTVSLSPRGDWRMPTDADPSAWLE
jgi:NAD+ synthase (glutamine-hydrolysing)